MKNKKCTSTCAEDPHWVNVAKSRKIQQWIKEGRCPTCGELGQFVNMNPVCSTHGTYPLLDIEKNQVDAKFDGGDCWKTESSCDSKDCCGKCTEDE